MDWLILTLFSAFLLALSTLIQKNVLSKEHSLEFVIAMFGFTSLILLPNFFFIDYNTLSIEIISWISLRAVLMAGGFLMFIKSLRRMDLSVAAPLSNLSSIGVIIVGMILLGERLNLIQFMGIMLIVIGTYTIQLKKDHSFFEPFANLKKSKNMHYALISILFFSFSAPITKYILSNYSISPFDYMHISFFVAFIALLIYYSFTGRSYNHIWFDAKKVGILIPIISMLDLLSMYTYISAVAIPTAMISFIVPIRKLSTLIDVIIAGKALHEADIMKKAMSTTVILTGVIVILL